MWRHLRHCWKSRGGVRGTRKSNPQTRSERLAQAPSLVLDLRVLFPPPSWSNKPTLSLSGNSLSGSREPVSDPETPSLLEKELFELIQRVLRRKCIVIPAVVRDRCICCVLPKDTCSRGKEGCPSEV